MTLNALSDYYQVLLYKDPFNFVGVLVSEEDQEQKNSQLSLRYQQEDMDENSQQPGEENENKF